MDWDERQNQNQDQNKIYSPSNMLNKFYVLQVSTDSKDNANISAPIVVLWYEME